MSYHDCAAAHQKLRQTCGSDPGAAGYSDCLKSLHIHDNENEPTACAKASSCIISGNTQRLFVCLQDGSKEAQIVRGTYYGNPSKVVDPK